MSLVLLFARFLLAVVFAVAGLAKLADRAGSRQALQDFGLPMALAGLFGLLLPLAELAVAVALDRRPARARDEVVAGAGGTARGGAVLVAALVSAARMAAAGGLAAFVVLVVRWRRGPPERHREW